MKRKYSRKTKASRKSKRRTVSKKSITRLEKDAYLRMGGLVLGVILVILLIGFIFQDKNPESNDLINGLGLSDEELNDPNAYLELNKEGGLNNKLGPGDIDIDLGEVENEAGEME